jgi:hypothetical protein
LGTLVRTVPYGISFVDEIAEESDGTYKVGKVNVDEHRISLPNSS